jgi:Holliday junction resolvase-like predicted endonuclease
MRGFLQPAVRSRANDVQRAFGSLSRHRQTKLARAAQTTLVKAHQWSRGDAVAPEVASALEGALRALQAKAPKKV